MIGEGQRKRRGNHPHARIVSITKPAKQGVRHEAVTVRNEAQAKLERVNGGRRAFAIVTLQIEGELVARSL